MLKKWVMNLIKKIKEKIFSTYYSDDVEKLSLYKYIKLSKYKGFEFETLFGTGEIFELSIYNRIKQDHGRFGLRFSIFKLFELTIQIIDSRHWDYDNDCYYKYDYEIKRKTNE